MPNLDQYRQVANQWTTSSYVRLDSNNNTLHRFHGETTIGGRTVRAAEADASAQTYINKYQDHRALREDFLRALESEFGKDTMAFFAAKGTFTPPAKNYSEGEANAKKPVTAKMIADAISAGERALAKDPTFIAEKAKRLVSSVLDNGAVIRPDWTLGALAENSALDRNHISPMAEALLAKRDMGHLQDPARTDKLNDIKHELLRGLQDNKEFLKLLETECYQALLTDYSLSNSDDKKDYLVGGVSLKRLAIDQLAGVMTRLEETLDLAELSVLNADADPSATDEEHVAASKERAAALKLIALGYDPSTAALTAKEAWGRIVLPDTTQLAREP